MIKNGADPLAQGLKSLTSMWENNTLTQEAANRFTAMMNTNISAVAISIAKSGLFKEFSNVADVGGGSGIFLAAMRQMYPEKMLTLFELPQVCEAAKDIIKHYIDPNSINYFAGSFFETTWPFEQQAYFLSNILHDWPPDKARLILKNVHQAIKPGGSLFINEALLTTDRLTPKHTVLFDLMMHLNHNSQQFTCEELCALVQSVGFQKPKKVFEFGYYTVLRADKTTN